MLSRSILLIKSVVQEKKAKLKYVQPLREVLQIKRNGILLWKGHL